jgi:hypothetical protein
VPVLTQPTEVAVGHGRRYLPRPPSRRPARSRPLNSLSPNSDVAVGTSIGVPAVRRAVAGLPYRPKLGPASIGNAAIGLRQRLHGQRAVLDPKIAFRQRGHAVRGHVAQFDFTTAHDSIDSNAWHVVCKPAQAASASEPVHQSPNLRQSLSGCHCRPEPGQPLSRSGQAAMRRPLGRVVDDAEVRPRRARPMAKLGLQAIGSGCHVATHAGSNAPLLRVGRHRPLTGAGHDRHRHRRRHRPVDAGNRAPGRRPGHLGRRKGPAAPADRRDIPPDAALGRRPAEPHPPRRHLDPDHRRTDRPRDRVHTGTPGLLPGATRHLPSRSRGLISAPSLVREFATAGRHSAWNHMRCAPKATGNGPFG